MPENKKKKPCPRCQTDMEVNGVCPNEDCGFNEGEAEDRAWGQAYVNKRAKEIQAEMEKKDKKGEGEGKKKRSFFS